MEKTYRVMVCKYGFAFIEAKSESEALGKVNSMRDEDFDWSKDYTSDDAVIVEEIED